jgi:hypothetical protein
MHCHGNFSPPQFLCDYVDFDMAKERTPEKIMQLGLGFWGSKPLLSAIELGIFTELSKETMQKQSRIAS